MKVNAITSLAGLLASAAMCLDAASASTSSSSSPSDRAWEMVQQMNITEKLVMLHGHKGIYIGNIRGNDRLNIPSINMHDGPQGFRTTMTTGQDGTSTAWPSALTVAAAWDEPLAHRWAASMASEFRQKGANVLLGPGIGIARVPNAGRNFEYLCGEDPYLGARLTGPVVRGIQSQGVMANAKHWVNNEIEEDRKKVSANLDERTAFEIYYPPFEAAVQAGVLSAMCAYNRVNDMYACENPVTISHLKDTLGFQGWLMSDWTATHSTAKAINARLDQELPFGIYFNEDRVMDALSNGTITESQIDDSVHRMLTSMYTIGLFDHRPLGNPLANVTSDEHNALAREIAAKSTVLLKNDGKRLPLNLASGTIKQIAVIGRDDIVSGDGSGHVNPGHVITPAQGLQNAIDRAGLADAIKVVYNDGKDSSDARDLAAASDLVIVTVATKSCEGLDRPSLSLGSEQDGLVTTVAAANPTGTVVVVTSPGAVLLPWLDSVPAVLMNWLPGQEAGDALADVLIGAINPSARLPVTIPHKDNEVSFTEAQYPGVGTPPEAAYSEGLQVGYRWYEANKVDPVFPFGYGLSYTTFGYANPTWQRTVLDSDAASRGADQSDVVGVVSVEVTNTGDLAGAEVAQLYLTFPAATGEPPNQLKGFVKTDLQPQETQTVHFPLRRRDLSVWDASSHAWVVTDGLYVAKVGASSRQLPLTVAFPMA